MLHFTEVKNPHIYIIGAGGTGGFAIEYLTRLFAASEQRVTIEVFDGDTVESKNLKRQNFTLEDLDKTKASALIGKLEKMVPNPPKLVANEEFLIDSDEFMSHILLNTEDDETAIVVSAVDNIATRRLINQTIEDLTDVLSVVALDSGNDNQGGQVVVFANDPVIEKQMLKQDKELTLKNMLELYPEIDVIKDERDENPGLVSYCAEESESKPQAMMANVRNGELLATLIYQLSQNQPLPYNVWTSSLLDNATKGSMKY